MRSATSKSKRLYVHSDNSPDRQREDSYHVALEIYIFFYEKSRAFPYLANACSEKMGRDRKGK